MNLIKKAAVLATATLFLGLAGCATNETNTDTTAPTNDINDKMKNSQVSAEAAKLINSTANTKELEEKLICVREKVAGSNFKKKVCRTKAEIEAQEEINRRDIQKIQRAGKGTSGN